MRPNNSTARLRVQKITCRYGTHTAVQDIAFELPAGQLACLLGPSGCGKTTVLRAIAGFHKLTGGEIRINEQCVAHGGTRIHRPPEQRHLSMVFQDHALFPHLTVAKNIQSALHRLPAAQQRASIAAMLERFSIQALAARYPHELSGGQQQRVALARALAPRPRLLLMDEPFSSLDLELRVALRNEIRDVLTDIGATCLLVTHDQQDAFAFGARIGVMQNGRLEQWDTAYQIYHQPRTRFVADFIGEGILLDGSVTATGEIATELALLRGDTPDRHKAGTKVQVLIRPDDILHDDHSPRSAKIIKRDFRGENYMYTLALPSGNKILSLVPSHHDHKVGENLGIRLDIDHLVVFPV